MRWRLTQVHKAKSINKLSSCFTRKTISKKRNSFEYTYFACQPNTTFRASPSRAQLLHQGVSLQLQGNDEARCNVGASSTSPKRPGKVQVSPEQGVRYTEGTLGTSCKERTRCLQNRGLKLVHKTVYHAKIQLCTCSISVCATCALNATANEGLQVPVRQFYSTEGGFGGYHLAASSQDPPCPRQEIE